jgi:UPF0716 protein FxsA
MFPKLLLAFILVPLIEIYILIEVGTVIGTWSTIGVVILTGVVGAYLARVQGLRTMLRIRESMDQGAMPTEDLFDAALILVAGVTLLTPGLLTDVAGVLLLIPVTRAVVKGWVRVMLQKWIARNQMNIRYYP